MDVPGCDGVEFDVRAAADGVPVLLHDDTLDSRPGPTGRGRRADIDRARVARCRLGSTDALAALPRRAFLDVELKESFGRGLIEVLASGRGPDLQNAVVSAFAPGDHRPDPRSRAGLAVLAQHPPPVRCATIRRATELGCVGISAEASAVTARAFRAAETAGLQVATWTVTRRATYRRLADLGAVAICVEGEALTG